MGWVPTSQEILVNITTEEGQGRSDVTALTSGGFAIGWTDTSAYDPDPEAPYNNADVKARIFGADGTPAGGEIAVNSILTDEQTNPALLALADGGFLVAYQDGSDATVGGTYITLRAFDAAGAAAFADWRAEGGSGHYYDSNPRLAQLDDGTIVLVYGAEDSAKGDAIDLTGQVATPIFQLGEGDYDAGDPIDFAATFVPEDIAALPGGAFAHVYEGHRDSLDNGRELDGIILWVRDGNGDPVAGPVQASAPGQEFVDAPVVAALGDGSIVVAWTSYDGDPRFGGSGDIYFRHFAADGTPLGEATLAHQGGGESQSAVDVVALADGGFMLAWQDAGGTLGDNSGYGIAARSFDADGTPTSDVFLVNQDTAGSQVDPHLAVLADGDVAISWTDGGGIGGADVKARVFAQQESLPDCPVITRPGTQSGVSAADEVLAGPDTANSFVFAGASGDDRIANFQAHDVLVSLGALFDRNGDGIVTFGSDGVLNLPGGGTVAIDGLDPRSGLRALGEACDGVFVYADASVRPAGAIEGLLGDDTLAGDAGDATGQVFFFDNALGLSLGTDHIGQFGTRDVIVTTTAIADSNHDGIITFGGDKLLDIGTGDVGLTGLNGHAVTRLEFDGSVTRDGVDYYVYSQVGSAVGTEVIAPPTPPQQALYYGGFVENVGTQPFKLTAPGETPQLLLGPGGEPTVIPVGFFSFAGDLYLTSDGELTRIDGVTGEATELGVRANPELSDRVSGNELDGALYVSGYSNASGGEQFRILPDSDTAQPFDALPGPAGVDPNVAFGFDGALYYEGYQFSTGEELIRQDATTGAVQFYDIQPGEEGSFPRNFTVFDGDLYFTASDDLGQELRRFDVAANAVDTLNIDEGEGLVNGLTVAGGKLYFSAEGLTTGQELYSLAPGSDTPTLVADIAAGEANSYPLGLTAFDGDLVFSADDGVAGRELYRLDGATGELTQYDLFAGAGGSNPTDFTVLDDTLYFAADTDGSGRELFLWKAGDAAPEMIDVTPGDGSTFSTGAFAPSPHFSLWNGKVVFLDTAGEMLMLEGNETVAPVLTAGGVPLTDVGEFVVI